MILLDTNVLSELVRPNPAPNVINWLAAQSPSAIFTTTITQAEIFYGLRLLPEGRRRLELTAAISLIFDQDLTGRVLPFDRDAAISFADLAAERRHAGNPICQLDAQIAAIARAHGATLATRNTRDFSGCGIALLDPWTVPVNQY